MLWPDTAAAATKGGFRERLIICEYLFKDKDMQVVVAGVEP
jgi:hypothetical protein